MYLVEITNLNYGGIQRRLTKLKIYAEALSLEVPPAILPGWYTNVNIRLEHVLPRSLKQRCLRDYLSNSVHIRGGLLSACHSLAAC